MLILPLLAVLNVANILGGVIVGLMMLGIPATMHWFWKKFDNKMSEGSARAEVFYTATNDLVTKMDSRVTSLENYKERVEGRFEGMGLKKVDHPDLVSKP